MFLEIVLLATGFLLLIKGADWLVGGASSLARKYRISDLAIGLTIVAFGTSSPELVVNTISAYEKLDNIIIGNVVGSNIFNLLAILGAAGLVTPMVVQSSTVWKEIPFSLLAVVVLFLMTNAVFSSTDTEISRFDGFVLLSFFGIFLFYVFRQLKRDVAEVPSDVKIYSTGRIWMLIVAGLGGLVFGGRLVVNNAVLLAAELGLSQKIIGLTIIAVGTSLPEFATSLVAAVRKHNDIAVGNIIGSNIFNLLFILAISALIHPIRYDLSFNGDLLVLGAGTLFLFTAMFTGRRRKLDRWEAGVLLGAYIAYMTYSIFGS